MIVCIISQRSIYGWIAYFTRTFVHGSLGHCTISQDEEIVKKHMQELINNCVRTVSVSSNTSFDKPMF